ncbi:MAG: lytic transglycosylase [Ktedonobacteraceae bacterium]
MIIAPVQPGTTPLSPHLIPDNQQLLKKKRFPHFRFNKQLALLIFTALLLVSSFAISTTQPTAHAANPGVGNACSWYQVRRGDTLSRIAGSHGTTIWTLARANNIGNVNLIFVGRELCIPYHVGGGSGSGHGSGGSSAGLLSNGVVTWYAYNALDWSSRSQVSSILHQVAARYGLPANLLMAIAWQESGWNQHVIAWDGGIGVMQLMPYTAMSINSGTGIRRNPYHLYDNINLGATYLSWLYHNFHGNLSKTISAYNEGGWAVIHRGIFNWHYVNNVLSLMREFR